MALRQDADSLRLDLGCGEKTPLYMQVVPAKYARKFADASIVGLRDVGLPSRFWSDRISLDTRVVWDKTRKSTVPRLAGPPHS